jgi:hypothetical protein
MVHPEIPPSLPGFPPFSRKWGDYGVPIKGSSGSPAQFVVLRRRSPDVLIGAYERSLVHGNPLRLCPKPRQMGPSPSLRSGAGRQKKIPGNIPGIYEKQDR